MRDDEEVDHPDGDPEARRALDRRTGPRPGARPTSQDAVVRRRVRLSVAVGIPAVLVLGTLAFVIADRGTDSGVRSDVATSPGAAAPVPPSDPAGPPEAGPGGSPGLEASTPGREISFEGIGDVRLGDPVDPGSVETIGDGDDCGSWGPIEPSHDGDEPLRGEVRGASTPEPTVSRIKVFENATYRTSEGVGIGTPLDTLRRVYGDGLVVDRADGWDRPTDGLVGLYVDVAAVRRSGAALTFLLHDDVVESVKLSRDGDWGDDEGCA